LNQHDFLASLPGKTLKQISHRVMKVASARGLRASQWMANRSGRHCCILVPARQLQHLADHGVAAATRQHHPIGTNSMPVLDNPTRSMLKALKLVSQAR
jgi:hypothetical protein